MKIYEIILYNDGGPNDKGTVIGYKKVLENEKPPESKNNFERVHEISLYAYEKAKEEARKNYEIFTF